MFEGVTMVNNGNFGDDGDGSYVCGDGGTVSYHANRIMKNRPEKRKVVFSQNIYMLK